MIFVTIACHSVANFSLVQQYLLRILNKKKRENYIHGWLYLQNDRSLDETDGPY